ncbi:type I secretion system permease/ATPase [Gemmobacter fulvus]|uniref:Type I secretion system permease/ATPase n=1 Tax=Gemmobacter fulvus TaxID=2840474 RepID=A0A975P9N5_9RHOB|nr:type I secretion system permease/ATPase [Gemmobacter fulvus]MBT9244737.1 type I secretion system permease/ATPase [Gemmobacter fulvus]MDQ1848733.1 type I secretion system permease/ATPase [Gemmobacter fulvus]QWK91588.1 type I secretion system permease/ATPase [Gemmobacter fulvus]
MSRNEAGFNVTQGVSELRAARRESNALILTVFLFSVVVNVLMLTGPLYMLQVYDRVLGSRSEATLIALSVLVVFLFIAMGLLDHARGRIMARIGAAFQAKLDRRVFEAALRRSQLAPSDPAATAAQRDLEAIQRLWASPVLLAVFDIPWTPLFVAAIFIFHPWMGWLAVLGGVVLIIVTILNQRITKVPLTRANSATIVAERMSDNLKAEAELVQALGMQSAGFDRWQRARGAALTESIAAADLGGTFSVLTKTFRLFLQSAMLGLGAWLVLKGELSSGAMIAGSILMGRALSPIEMAVGQWAVVQRAQEGWARLSELFTRMPKEPARTQLPRPKALLEAQNLTVVPPGESHATLRMVNFRLEPGQALGVIGPSGSGKSTLARALIGAWRPAGGKVRLDGAALDQYDPDVLGSYVGYLPQRVTLFEGTIAENIARLQANPDGLKVVEAARKAAAHDMIVKLPDGYDTRVSALGGRLSGGQIQRIGLARAMYGNPVIMVLDEPNSNLDNEGSMALNIAIRSMKEAGCSILIMAHRPAAIQECDLLMVMEEGTRRAFGPRDQVLREMVKNHTEIVKNAGPGGVT